MITVETKQTVEDLKNLEVDMKRRFERMIGMFASDIADMAISNTPIGDDDTEKSVLQYLARQKSTGLDPMPGFAQGSWQVSFSTQIFQKAIYDAQTASDNASMQSKNYQLGDLLYIGNKGPYIGLLEKNFSDKTMGMGILKPTIAAIEAVYKTDLVRYYQQ